MTMVTSDQKTLTISIPTWNRGVLVKEALEIIIAEVSEHNLEDHIEVQITNNASTDDTEKIVKEYASKYRYIHYTNNGVNIGLGPNVLKCMYLANGKYCLLLGDDDRLKPGALPRLIEFLQKNPDTGLLLDTSKHKRYPVESDTGVSLTEFLQKYYYYLGNAGVFVVLSSYIKENYSMGESDGISFSWPQTQFMVLSSFKHPENKIILANLELLGPSEHAKITLYNSFYLWKVAYFELVSDIENIRKWLDDETYKAARKCFYNQATQNFYNILQCGVFVDDQATRTKTRKHITESMHYFSGKEKLLLKIAVLVLGLPTVISRPLSNIFIYCIRGKKGLEKKNAFVNSEKEKLRVFNDNKKTVIRHFSYQNSASSVQDSPFTNHTD